MGTMSTLSQLCAALPTAAPASKPAAVMPPARAAITNMSLQAKLGINIFSKTHSEDDIQSTVLDCMYINLLMGLPEP